MFLSLVFKTSLYLCSNACLYTDIFYKTLVLLLALNGILWLLSITKATISEIFGHSLLFNSLFFNWFISIISKHVIVSYYSDGSYGKESSCTAGDPASIPWLARYPGEGNGYPLQYSCLENAHGQRTLVGYSQWGHKELDMTEWLKYMYYSNILTPTFVLHLDPQLNILDDTLSPCSSYLLVELFGLIKISRHLWKGSWIKYSLSSCIL